MSAIQDYLINTHHSTPDDLVNCLQRLLEYSQDHRIDPTLKDRLTLQLDADSANADLFYNAATAHQIRQYVRQIQANLL